ncbi:heat shock protein 70 [Tribonema minus]|uniref:Heat shock protein 70 n=1 Tax=Tribonema minus TaxID=303371 RepID=A0A835ZE09_9STRA|nr:heat shock protein 70 [Tribonema minus]
MPVAVGIDLGSTHCNVGIWHHGRPEIIANHHGLRATPTMVAYTDEEVLVGEAALTQMPKNIKNTVFGFKWMVGVAHAELEPHVVQLLASAPFKCVQDASGAARVEVTHKGEDRSIGPETLCSHLFEHLKSIAEQFSGESVGKCVLSVPADFTQQQRDALQACGKAAGLPFSLISDPVATAMAYGLDRTDAEISSSGRDEAHASAKATVLVVDFGGGGVEATVLTRRDGMLAIAATERDATVGGDVFVQRLVEFCAKDHKRKTGMDVFESKRGLLKLRRECESAVKALSMTQQAEPYVEAMMEGVDFKTRITRMRFEDLCYDLYDRAKEPILRAMKACGKAPEEVDEVLLAGGIAHMPRIQALVRGLFPEKTVFGAGLFPDEAVAIGATIQASLLDAHPNPAGANVPLPQSLPLSPVALGLRCLPPASADSDPEASPQVLAVINVGEPLPAQHKVDLKLARDGADGSLTVILQVLQLGSEEPSVLGNLVFAELPAGDLEFEVGLTLRTEGVLKAEALEKKSRAVQSVVIGKA